MSTHSSGTMMEYDEHGDLLIRVPKRLVKRFEENMIFLALENMVGQVAKTRMAKSDYEKDPIWGIVGIGESDVTNGSINHDKYLYGDPNK